MGVLRLELKDWGRRAIALGLSLGVLWLGMFALAPVGAASPEPEIVTSAASAVLAPMTSAIATTAGEGSPREGVSKPVFLPLSPSERLELEELRVEARLRGLIDRQLISSPTVRDRIELEVDRAFERTTTLLNTLLALLVALPVLVAVAAWLLRRSITAQLVAEARSQLESEILNELRQEQQTVVGTIRGLQSEAVDRLETLTGDAEALLGALKQQTDLAQSEIDMLKGDLALRMEAMVADAATLKERTMQELVQVLPSSMQTPVPPDRQSKLGQLTSFLDQLRSAIPQLEFSVSDYIRQGNGLFFESRYQDALELYDRALELDPNAFEAWLSRAATLAMLRRDEAASAAYERSLQINPTSFDAWFGMAGVLQRLGKGEQAITGYEKAATLDPTDPQPWAKQGELYMGAQGFQEALTSYDRALALRPDQTEWLLQQAIAQLALDEPSRGLALLGEVLKLDGNLPEAFFQKAIAHLQLKEFEEARTALGKAIQLKPEYGERAQADSQLKSLL